MPRAKWSRCRRPDLNAAELAIIRQGFRGGRAPVDVARELQCTPRTVRKHYRALRAERRPANEERASPRSEKKPAKIAAQTPRPRKSPAEWRQTRFYHSNFEPS